MVKLVYETADMNRQLAAVHVVCLFAEQIEKLRVDHRNQEVEGAVRIAHDEEQSCFARVFFVEIAQRVQFQLIVCGQLPKLLNVERGEPCAATNQNGFCCFA